MTETMVERVARAMASEAGEGWWVFPDPEEAEATEKVWMVRARIALSAMREPTEAMKEAGAEAGDWVEPADDDHDRAFAGEVFRAMIDTALQEQDK